METVHKTRWNLQFPWHAGIEIPENKMPSLIVMHKHTHGGCSPMNILHIAYMQFSSWVPIRCMGEWQTERFSYGKGNQDINPHYNILAFDLTSLKLNRILTIDSMVSEGSMHVNLGLFAKSWDDKITKETLI